MRGRAATLSGITFITCVSLLAFTGLASGERARSSASTSFGFTGGTQSYPVPSSICSVSITADGGHGGSGYSGGSGGSGAYVSAHVPVTHGSALTVVVGGAGGAGGAGAGGDGGYGGGGGGAIYVNGGGGGGGASVVTSAGGSALVVAGAGGGGGSGDIPATAGGGGGAVGNSGGTSTDGGAGGLASGDGGAGGSAGDFGGGGGGGVGSGGSGNPGGGGNGGSGSGEIGGGGGGGGQASQSSGGDGGAGGSGTGAGGASGAPGSNEGVGGGGTGTGGDGATGGDHGGGGGAGGVGFGGGGGARAGGGGGAGYGAGGGGVYSDSGESTGGGGGSSHVTPSATNVSSHASSRTGNGQVTISYDSGTDACQSGSTGIAVTSSTGVPNRGDTYLAFDGNTNTFTYTTPSFNSQTPSYLEFFFDSTEVDRLRLYTDTYCGYHDLTIQYTTNGSDWTSVSGMQAGFQGAEPFPAASVNSDGTVTTDQLDSPNGDGFASLVFDPVTASGMRIAFTGTSCTYFHYRAYEVEAYDVVDGSPPDITPDVSPAPNGNGWNNTSPTVTWDVSEPDSWITDTSGCSSNVVGETSGTDFTCQATSLGGTNSQTVTVKVDASSPGVNCDSPDSSWHATNVSLSCTASDTGSGLADSGDASFNLTTSVPAGSEDANASTGSHDVYDAADNVTTAGPYTGIMVDRKAPAISCDSPDGVWHSSNVTLSCTASDGGSGLANSGDASFTLSTSVASGAESANASTGSHQVCDNVGNCATAGPIAGNMIDRKAPGLSCASADGNWHAANVSLGCTSSDNGSGLAVSGDASFNLSTSVASGSENSNASTGSHQVCDNVNNCVTAGPISGNKIDRKNPTSSCGAADGVWHGSNVSIACTSSDSGSGLANAGDASFNLSTSVASGSETSNASTGSHQVCDVAGNCVTDGPVAGNKIDRKAPVLSCGAADGNWHSSNVSIGCTGSDGGSGLANAGDSAFDLSTSVAAGSEDANASTGSRQVCDNVNNCSTAGPISGNKVDRKPPALNISNPSGSGTASNPPPLASSSITVAFSVNDGGSGVTGWTLTRYSTAFTGSSCPGGFAQDPPVTGGSGGSLTDPETLSYGRCYYWTLSGTDALGNVAPTIASEVVRLSKFSAGPSPLAFGSIKHGTVKKLTETFKNQSGGPLKLTSVGVSGSGFHLVAGGTCTVGKTLAALGSCTVNVTFTPGFAGSYAGTVSVGGGGDKLPVPTTGAAT